MKNIRMLFLAVTISIAILSTSSIIKASEVPPSQSENTEIQKELLPPNKLDNTEKSKKHSKSITSTAMQDPQKSYYNKEYHQLVPALIPTQIIYKTQYGNYISPAYILGTIVQPTVPSTNGSTSHQETLKPKSKVKVSATSSAQTADSNIIPPKDKHPIAKVSSLAQSGSSATSPSGTALPLAPLSPNPVSVPAQPLQKPHSTTQVVVPQVKNNLPQYSVSVVPTKIIPTMFQYVRIIPCYYYYNVFYTGSAANVTDSAYGIYKGASKNTKYLERQVYDYPSVAGSNSATAAADQLLSFGNQINGFNVTSGIQGSEAVQRQAVMTGCAVPVHNTNNFACNVAYDTGVSVATPFVSDNSNKPISIQTVSGYQLHQYYTTPAHTTGGAASIMKNTTTIPTLNIKFNGRITARSSHVGDSFQATTLEPVILNNQTFPIDSLVRGKIIEVIRPGAGNAGVLKIAFTDISYGNNTALLPKDIIYARVIGDNKQITVARVVEAPFTWVGKTIGIVGRTVGGATVLASNVIEQVFNGIGIASSNFVAGQWGAARQTSLDSFVALGKAPIDITKTAFSGGAGVLNTSSDQLGYIVDSNNSAMASINPNKRVLVAFGCSWY